MVFREKFINFFSRDSLYLGGYDGSIREERSNMKNSICIPEEHILVELEQEIIEEKTKAYRVTLEQIYKLPVILEPFVFDYKKKLERQFDVLFKTAKEIYSNPAEKEALIRRNFRKYYQKI